MVNGMMNTYKCHPVPQVYIAPEVGDEIRRDTHDDESRDPVQNVIGEDQRTEHLVRCVGRGAVVVSSGVSSHCARRTWFGRFGAEKLGEHNIVGGTKYCRYCLWDVCYRNCTVDRAQRTPFMRVQKCDARGLT
jgi:hypothetical protein